MYMHMHAHLQQRVELSDRLSPTSIVTTATSATLVTLGHIRIYTEYLLRLVVEPIIPTLNTYLRPIRSPGPK